MNFRRLTHPEDVMGEAVAWIAGVGILVNGLSAFLFFKDKDKESGNKKNLCLS